MRGRKRSSAYFVSPVTFAHASILESGRPMTENSCFSIEGGLAPSESIDRDGSGVVPIVVLLATRGRLAAHAKGGELDGIEDLGVTGAAAEVAGQRLLDLGAGRHRVVLEEPLGREEDPRRAVAALGGAQLGEGLLEGMERAALGHAFYRGDRAPLHLHRQR